MDSKKTIERLKGESDRATVSLYISQSVYADFKKVCEDVSPSRVVEELMREFIEDAKSSKVKKK